jgi:hypothetical protein
MTTPTNPATLRLVGLHGPKHARDGWDPFGDECAGSICLPHSALDRPERPNAGNADQAAVVGGSASSDLLDADDQPEKIP